MSEWSQEELFLLEDLRPYNTFEKIRKEFQTRGFDRSFKALQNKALQLGIYYKNSSLSNPVRPSLKKISPVEHTKESVLTSLQKLEEEAKKIINKKKLVSISPKGEHLILCLSDFHYGAIVRNENGKTLYDTEIAEKQIAEIPQKIMAAVPDRKYVDITILLIGDMIDGEEIYATQGHHIDIPLIDQITGAVKSIWKVILILQKKFDRVFVHAVRGNHGRMSKTANERTNWDNVLYHELVLLASFEGNEKIVVDTAYSDYKNLLVGKWRGHIRHEGVPHDGTPAYRAKLGSWYTENDFDFFVCGHFHNAGILGYNGRLVIRNGSLLPPTDFVQRLGRADPSRQIIFGVSETALPTFINYINW